MTSGPNNGGIPGGIQAGAYGYAHSPYSPSYVTAAYGSGSSNGSGTATSASFAAFGMAEETLSSGRSPASNNALVAYTPSRGLISIRGNWPLRPTCDVVVPHTRTVDDLLRVLDVVVSGDPDSTGDFWRNQDLIAMPNVAEIRPRSFLDIRRKRLDGVKLGVPRQFLGGDQRFGNAPVIRDSVKCLWERAVRDLSDLGAEIVPVNLPVLAQHEDESGVQDLQARGYVTAEWQLAENGILTAMALEEFLQTNADPTLRTWTEVDCSAVFPNPPDHTYTMKGRHVYDWQRIAELVKHGLPNSYREIPGAVKSLEGLENARKNDFERHLINLGLDGIVFPANGDVARADLDECTESMDHALQNGVVYSNGDRAIRHLGIPTVTVPMGWMTDTKMPVGLTFATRAYADSDILGFACAYERITCRRTVPYRTPSLPSNKIRERRQVSEDPLLASTDLNMHIEILSLSIGWEINVTISGPTYYEDDTYIENKFDVQVWADGMILRKDHIKKCTFSGILFFSRRRLNDITDIVIEARHLNTGEIFVEHRPENLKKS
jgi:amidase